MKKLFIITALVAFGFGLTSCACDCVGPNDGNANNKICKTDYENVYGAGSWANYESTAKAAGYICK